MGWEPLLLNAGYQFAWFDGLNRFYIANEEFERLMPLVALPPNVFDRFIRSLDITVSPPTSKPNVLRSVVLSNSERIELATRCRDCDDVPKVADAGQVRVREDGTRVQLMHNGLRVLADGYCGPWMTSLIERCLGHHEPQEERQFHAVLQALPADATMIELGGNWAYYTAWFLQGASDRRAVVLEPDPANRAVGERTMDLNGLQASFVAGVAGMSPSPPQPFVTERSGTLLLQRFSVPQLMAMYAIQQLDLLHCDTQGAEVAILEGCRALFKAGRVGFVFISTHVHQATGDPLTHYRCLSILRECEAVIEVEHDPYESFSGDGLIVARLGQPPFGWRRAPMSRARRNEAVFRDPCFDLGEALQSLARHNSTDSSLIQILQEYGRVHQTEYSNFGNVTIVDNNPVIHANGTQTGALLYGPYCPCSLGRYECAFLIRLDSGEAPLDTATLIFDTTLDGVSQSDDQICRLDELRPGEFGVIQFAFDVSQQTGTLETRLMLRQPIALTVVAAVALRRAQSPVSCQGQIS